ncbi:hypothetical protein D6D26_06835 [Aureobasidium pullulans]|nr:hypothetical protein D6D26_06835 [Aureobasidium pullulans]
MHLNLPAKSSTNTEKLIPYLYWCVIGIFGPELAIWAAWRQLLSARALKREIGESKLTPYDFSLSHGFYAGMGGYAFDCNQSFDLEQETFWTKTQRITLTPKGVLLLASCGHLPEITSQEIADKSKVDELGKLVACLQAGWFTVQIISRLACGLPITLLEVTVVGHVVCALVLYALWWHKPRRIEEPTILRGFWTGPLAAFMVMSSHIDAAPGSMLPGFQVEQQTLEITTLKFRIEPDDGTVQAETLSNGEQELDKIDSSLQVRTKTGLSLLYEEEIVSKDTIVDWRGQAEARLRLACLAIQQHSAVRTLLRRPICETDRKYASALAAYPEMPKRCRKKRDREAMLQNMSPWLECDAQNLVTHTASDWPHDGLVRTTGGLVMGTVLWVASIAFSAVHIAAWNAGFPSEAEAWLWRFSSMFIGFSGLLWAFLHIIAELSASLWWTWYDIMIGEASQVLTMLVTALCSMCGVVYILARAFLVIEAFVELRSLPTMAYAIPQWSVSIPHVG